MRVPILACSAWVTAKGQRGKEGNKLYSRYQALLASSEKRRNMKTEKAILIIEVETDIPVQYLTKQNIVISFNRAGEVTRFPKIIQCFQCQKKGEQ